jgi:hypothetical protein
MQNSFLPMSPENSSSRQPGCFRVMGKAILAMLSAASFALPSFAEN